MVRLRAGLWMLPWRTSRRSGRGRRGPAGRGAGARPAEAAGGPRPLAGLLPFLVRGGRSALGPRGPTTWCEGTPPSLSRNPQVWPLSWSRRVWPQAGRKMSAPLAGAAFLGPLKGTWLRLKQNPRLLSCFSWGRGTPTPAHFEGAPGDQVPAWVWPAPPRSDRPPGSWASPRGQGPFTSVT